DNNPPPTGNNPPTDNNPPPTGNNPPTDNNPPPTGNNPPTDNNPPPTDNNPPPASTPGDVVGFSLQNTSGGAEATGYVSFGQVFGKGDVMPGSNLVAKINGVDVPVQMDVKTTNEDGSVAHAILTLKAP